ncbi:alpha-mannosidase [Cellulomonas edaphi]|uniref:Glycoside hydrolase family 38 C-terminal domain-containing protein n=1 Tax=Cellulomonas edaphi TaxID=3053468 RepID=A0ABT7S372_9CELL|nr:glycoside hydrolase family 38 C-terminal domain-containing protein [Cellulomons edaphi]MDM7830061.1 glycoside hydrolase family 38 C-terminal domain-containing protein [Cellulomons edaphi]
MHGNPLLTEERIDRFVRERIVPAVYRERLPLRLTAWDAPGEPVPFAQALEQEYRPVEVGLAWGAPWSTTWFRVTGEVPDGWPVAGTAVELVIDLGFNKDNPGFQAEGLVWRTDGTTIKGVSPFNQAVPWSDGTSIDVLVEAAGNPNIASNFGFVPTPYGELATAGTEPQYELRCVDVALRDVAVWELWQDLTALVGLMKALPATSTRRAQLRHGLDRVVDEVDPEDVAGSAEAARELLRPLLDAPAAASAHQVVAVGHAHIDSAWLWPLRETVRKCARTFSNVLALMDEDPDFVFACSSAQQYSWMKQFYPDLFDRIRKKVAAGQFVPVGGMWVESDTNMPGGEAMARQMVAGKRFFLEEFGVDTQDVWLPDSFGYSGALPQIVRSAGSRWFLSQKLSWNDTDRMPHHTFTWEGIDGSSVLTHFPPVDTYNSDLSAKELLHTEANFEEKGVAGSSIAPYGWGDGGGGPTREMVASAHRFENLEGAPRVELGSPNAFFERTEQQFEHPPVWTGEMYLEFHRGTYTSQARTKQGNRRTEHLLREAELWAATAAVQNDTDYPYDELETLWHTALLHQFHDILPGSSIGWVHRQAEETYAKAAAELDALIDAAASSALGSGDTPFLLNAAPHVRQGVAPLAAAEPQPAEGDPVRLVREPDGTVRVQNGLIDVHLTAGGQIDSLRDLVADREVIPAGALANLLQLHRDLPAKWDAWDIDKEYRRVATDLLGADSREVVEESADAVVVRTTRDFGESRLVQEITFRRGSAAIEIVTDVDWHERQKLLKLAFPLAVQADRSAAETQFGHVFRPTHANTSWDAARFETCAHRWVHVGEAGYGVAVANDSTYGHDVTRTPGAKGTVVRLSLLRAPIFPDPEADQGRHRLTTVLHPGANIAAAIEDGYRTNLPARVVRGARAVEPLVTVSNPAIVVESVKLAEDRSGDVIVRLYESLGGLARGTVVPTFAVAGARTVDLLERAVEVPEADVSDAGVTLALRPFQIVTLRLPRA